MIIDFTEKVSEAQRPRRIAPQTADVLSAYATKNRPFESKIITYTLLSPIFDLIQSLSTFIVIHGRRMSLDCFPIDMPLLISASNLGGGGGAAGQDLVVLLNVDDSGIGGGSGNATNDSGRVGEGDGTEVGKGDQLAGGIALLKVLDDPLGVILAERAIGHAGEGLLHGGTGSQVLNGRSAASLACCNDGHLDRVTSGDGDAREVVYMAKLTK